MNVITATGNIGRDAELRFMKDQTQVAGFSFALSSGYGKNAKTDWLECSLFGKRAEVLAPMLIKGTKIAISGEFSIREWNDKDGNLRTTPSVRIAEVTLLGKKPEGEAKAQAPQPKAVEVPDFDAFEDDVPF